jgi:uncharacterized protein (DUF342 family)
MKSVRKIEDNAKVLELLVSDDNLKLFVKAEPKAQHPFILDDDILKEILAVSREELIDKAVIKDIARELRMAKPCEERRVAKGVPATPGRDGKLVWLVRRFTPGKKSEDLQQELNDFFTLGLFENIEKGREIARVYKPTLGTSGKDVLGKEIFAVPGKPFEPKVKESIARQPAPGEENYDLLVAAIDGYVHEEGGVISVRDTLQIPENLDFAMGHIDFIGNVKVAGDVQKGFHIKARGNIDIAGSVLGDNVLTSGGSVTIKEFHSGGKGGSVRAKGVYSVGVAHCVSTEVHGNIQIGREARDCALRSLSAIFSDRGAIVGGSLWCVKGFEGATLGNEVGAKTVVEVRNEVEVTIEYKELSENIKKYEAVRAALELHAGPYLKNRKRVQLLNPGFREKITVILKKYDQCKVLLDSLLEQAKTMRASAARQSEARVNVTKGIYAGVVLSSGEVCMVLTESVQSPASFKLSDDGQSWIKVDLKPLPKE